MQQQRAMRGAAVKKNRRAEHRDLNEDGERQRPGSTKRSLQKTDPYVNQQTGPR